MADPNTNFTPCQQSKDLAYQAKTRYILEKSLLEINRERWAARRQMSWVALFALIAFTPIILFMLPASSLSALSTAISWFYLSMASVIGIGGGAEAVSYISNMRGQLDPSQFLPPEKPDVPNPSLGMKTPFDDDTTTHRS